MLTAIALCFLGLGACAATAIPATSALPIIGPTLRSTPAPTVTLPLLSTPQPAEDVLDSLFHLHRYDAQGRGDALDGQWRIDAISYQ
jgi:hypothetical protein